MNYYYLNANRETVGPVSALEMAALRQAGVVRPDTLVVLEGDQEWRTASLVLPPPLPRNAGSRKSSARLAPSGGWWAIAGTAAALVLLIGGGVAWALLKKDSFSDDIEKMSRARDVEAPADSGVTQSRVTESAVKTESAEPILGRIETVPLTAAPPAPPPPPKMPEELKTETAQITPAPSTAAEEHLLGEWYEFGYGQGTEIAGAFHDLGQEPVADRAHLLAMIANLDVDPATVSQPNMRICLEGYKDGVVGKPVRYKPKSSQTASMLPEDLRLYTLLPEPEESKGRINLEKAVACTVLIQTYVGNSFDGHGSGFFVAPGLVATNKHVIDGAEALKVTTSDKRSFDAVVVEVSVDADFALLRINLYDHPVLEVAKSDTVSVGDEVVAVGFPVLATMSATTTFGRIASVDRNFGESGGEAYFQTDLSINHGNSGGPLIDAEARVIGVNTFGINRRLAERINFALKLDAVAPLIRKHMKR